MNGIEDENLRRLINSLVIELYKYQAESERKKIKERQAQGIEIAKKKGKFKGRQLKFKKNDPRLKHAFDLFLKNKLGSIAERLEGIEQDIT